MNCDKCQFWDAQDNKMQGLCRRSAPIPYHESGKITATWCITGKNEWCGEFKDKKKVYNKEKDAFDEWVEPFQSQELMTCVLPNGNTGWKAGKDGKCYARKSTAEKKLNG